MSVKDDRVNWSDLESPVTLARESCILDLLFMLKYNYLHCFSILLDHAYINKHDLI